jgi:hypothetical protein
MNARQRELSITEYWCPAAESRGSWSLGKRGIDWSREVLVLYLDRPGSTAGGSGAAGCGRFGYSDLKEAALSGASDLWVLNRVGLVPGE